MRVLHFDVDDLGNVWGGGQARRTYEISRRLSEWFGWEVTVVTGNYPGAKPCAVEVRRGSLRYVRAGVGPFPLNIISFVASIPLLARLHPHDLAVEDFTTPIGPSMLPHVAPRPVIGSVQFLFADEMARKYRVPFNVAASKFLRGYRSLITLTHHGRLRVQAPASQATVHVVPQGLNSDAFVPPDAINGEGDHVLFLGRLDRDQKGLDTLLDAWHHLRPGLRPPLIIAGDGRDGSALRQRAHALSLDDSIRFVGRVDGDVKADLFRRARVVVMPSRYETYGIVAIEALARGVALVASDLPELREVASAGACLVPSGNPRALAASVTSLWDDRDRRVALGAAGRASVEGLTWEYVTSLQASIYAASS